MPMLLKMEKLGSFWQHWQNEAPPQVFIKPLNNQTLLNLPRLPRSLEDGQTSCRYIAHSRNHPQGGSQCPRSSLGPASHLLLSLREGDNYTQTDKHKHRL